MYRGGGHRGFLAVGQGGEKNRLLYNHPRPFDTHPARPLVTQSPRCYRSLNFIRLLRVVITVCSLQMSYTAGPFAEISPLATDGISARVQPDHSYKHNEHFLRKQAMIGLAYLTGLAHLIQTGLNSCHKKKR